MTTMSVSHPAGPDPAGTEPVQREGQAPRRGVVDVQAATRAAGAFLTALGFDLDHPDTAATPGRMARAWAELVTPATEAVDATVFTAPPGCSGLVVVRGIEFVSVCEHHGLPFRGHAIVGYLPGEVVVGLSKLARVVEFFARRPQIQERLTGQIADWISDTLATRAVGVHVRAEHLCMSLRGARVRDAWTETSAYRGRLETDALLRTEWLAHVHSTPSHRQGAIA